MTGWRRHIESVSLHEAAHAVAAVVAGHRISEVVIGEDGGHVRHRWPADLAEQLATDPRRVLDLLAITAAGAWAERLWGRRPSSMIDEGAASDEAALAAYLAPVSEVLRAKARDLVDRHTLDLLRSHRAQIEAVARDLRRRRRLRYSDVLVAMGRAPRQLALPGVG